MANTIIDFTDIQLLSMMADGYNAHTDRKIKFSFRSGEVNPIQLRMDDKTEYSFANADVAMGFMIGIRDALGLNRTGGNDEK